MNTLHNPPSYRNDTVIPLPMDVRGASWAVDAACSGNPGPMEYQCIDLQTGAQVFHFGPVQGTNNIGEFLAIVAPKVGAVTTLAGTRAAREVHGEGHFVGKFLENDVVIDVFKHLIIGKSKEKDIYRKEDTLNWMKVYLRLRENRPTK